jgi:sec-independent protein translocase protein TatB
MFGIGFFELIVIAAIALVFIGPKNLPKVMQQLGRLVVQFRRVSSEVRTTFDEAMAKAEADILKEEREKLKKVLELAEGPLNVEKPEHAEPRSEKPS